jgi:hypothetical protein
MTPLPMARTSPLTSLRRNLWLGPIFGLMVAACGDAGPPSAQVDGDSGIREAGVEAGAEAGVEAGAEAGVEGGADARLEADGEGGGDSGAVEDAGTDSAPDVAAEDAETPDGVTPGDAPGACNALVPEGPLVPQTVVGGSQPAASGGNLFAGTYWLTDRFTYGGVPDGLFVQRTLVLEGSTVDVVGGTTASDAGTPVLETTTASYQVFDTVVFSTDESCPGPPHTTNVLFTASGGQLTLYPTADSAEVYELQ